MNGVELRISGKNNLQEFYNLLFINQYHKQKVNDIHYLVRSREVHNERSIPDNFIESYQGTTAETYGMTSPP